MTNQERIDVATDALLRARDALVRAGCFTKINSSLVGTALNHVRVANSALQSLERSVAGQPEPEVGT